ncbi:MAG TPA: replication-associated recombination protein A [Enteractinococcus helveticum]|uniref:Replication-associated recombination protein A n=1 Tax=Enteractinococcus helveticum TaxID=1837282 RepID=A0A921FLA3_9MICC|nr:replication-associated recombination protein A [Enteractinococcus helveticum]HJF14133.1 replication-associated recombination protein A [Enteractinococcus helveticum]
MQDLFSSAHDDDDDRTTTTGRASAGAPLAVRMRPRTLDEIVGQQHLLTPGSPLRKLTETTGTKNIGPTSIILYGPPGTGKTTLAHVISHAPDRKFVELSAISAGVKDVRQVMDQALDNRDLYGRTTILFLDEIHRFNKAQQDALLPGVENGWVILVAATTENPSFSVVAPLLSRSIMLTLEPLTDEDIGLLIERALVDERGLNNTVELDEEARDYLIRMAQGDARRALTTLEAAAGVAVDQHGTNNGPAGITVQYAAQAMDQAVLRYDKDGDQHYDVISAFIKSIRGSDVDAALHYLARMIHAGEDPRYIARRLIVHASEDVGMADPTALQTAVAAAQAVQLIGMPEGRIPLAQAVVHLATAPKSNASYVAIDAALADVKSGHAGTVPKPLRDAHYPGAKALGHGVGYKYPHAYPHAITDQQYLPDELQGREYYQPTGNGREQMLAERVDRLRAVIRNQPMPQSQPTPEADAQGPEQQELRSVRNNVADD